LALDFIDLGLAVYLSDWLSHKKVGGTTNLIRVALPLRNYQIFNSEDIRSKLTDLLGWFTGDKWKFQFYKRSSKNRSIARQPVFEYDSGQESQVSLWSGGLDALAGLYNSYKSFPSRRYYLVGAGFNSKVYKLQKKLAKEVSNNLTIDLHLFRLLYNLRGTSQMRKHSFVRSRGLGFIFSGVGCALAVDCKKLYIYENGIGAINLPYRHSEVGLDHTRALNPKSLIEASELVSQVLNQEFEILNPCVLSTKAEMCRNLKDGSLLDAVFDTKSCDSPHRKVPSQCGSCSSCILRRQALVAAGIEDRTKYVIQEESDNSASGTHFINGMIHQVNTLADILHNDEKSTDDKWIDLVNEYPDLDYVADSLASRRQNNVEQIREGIMDLYKKYCHEWMMIQDQLLTDFPHSKEFIQSKSGERL